LTLGGRFKLCREDYYIELFIERSIFIIIIDNVDVYFAKISYNSKKEGSIKLVLDDLINDKLKRVRVRACFDCHVYCIIDVNNYKAIQLLTQFENTHRGHRTQVVPLDELKPKSSADIEYTNVSDLNYNYI